MNFSQSQSQTIVAGSVFGILVMGMADDYMVKDQNPSFKFFLAVAITGASLAYISDVSPESAAWLAIIIFVVVLMEEGAPVLKAIQNSEKVGKVSPQGSGHVNDFPVIPFVKKPGKKIPRPITKPFPPLLPIKPRTAPAPSRERVRINLRKFPTPFFSPVPIPGNSREAEVELPEGQKIRIPWKGLAEGAGAGVGAAAIAKGVVEFIGASLDEVVRPVG